MVLTVSASVSQLDAVFYCFTSIDAVFSVLFRCFFKISEKHCKIAAFILSLIISTVFCPVKIIFKIFQK